MGYADLGSECDEITSFLESGHMSLLDSRAVAYPKMFLHLNPQRNIQRKQWVQVFWLRSFPTDVCWYQNTAFISSQFQLYFEIEAVFRPAMVLCEKVTPPPPFISMRPLYWHSRGLIIEDSSKVNQQKSLTWLNFGCNAIPVIIIILVDDFCNTNSAIPQFNLQSPQQGIKWLWYQDIAFKGY